MRLTPLRVIFDTSVILAQMTPDPRHGSMVWQWMTDGVVQPVVSDYLVDELLRTLAQSRFRLSFAARNAIVAEYLQYAEVFTTVPASGATSRDPTDVPVLELAIFAGVDVLVSVDGDLLDLDGEFSFRIVRPTGLYEMLRERDEGQA